MFRHHYAALVLLSDKTVEKGRGFQGCTTLVQPQSLAKHKVEVKD